MSDPTTGPTQAAPQQPIAPPPGWTPPPGGQSAGYPPPEGPQGAYGPPPTAGGGGVKLGTGALLGIASVVAMVLAVSLSEDGDNGWGRIGVWAGFGVAAALLTLAPAARAQLNLDSAKAWRVGAAGAAGLAAFWVLFVLPSISMNVSFAATVAVVAGIAAVWTAPGRPSPQPAGQTW